MTDLSAETMASNIADGWITYIVGPNHFQNALLAAYIETHSKGNSTVLSSITAIGKCQGFFCEDAELVKLRGVA